MSRRNELYFSVLILAGALLACKRSSDAAPSASATPEEPPAATAAPETPTPAATDEPAPPDPAPSPAVVGKKPAPGPKPTTKPTTTPKDAGTPPPKDAAASKPSGPSKACVQKCQSALQGCLTPGVTEAGVPKLPNVANCQNAFRACQAACK